MLMKIPLFLNARFHKEYSLQLKHPFFHSIMFILLFNLAAPLMAKDYYVAVCVPLSGESKVEGQAIVNAVKIYVEEVNSSDSLSGNRINLIIRDDQNNKKIARQLAEELSKNKDVIAVIGHITSSVAIAGGKIYNREKLTLISPAATSPAVTRNSPWVFSMNYVNIAEAQKMAAYLSVIKKSHNIVLLRSNTVYGNSIADNFSSKAHKLGMNIVKKWYIPKKKQTKPDSLDESIFAPSRLKDFVANSEGKVDAIVMSAHTFDSARVIKQIRQQGIDIPIIGPSSFVKNVFPDLIQPYSNNIMAISPFIFELAPLRAKDFIDKYQKTYNTEPSIRAAFSYDALQLISTAMRQVEQINRANIRQHLASINNKIKAVDGVSGKLYFDEFGALQRQSVVVNIDQKIFKPAFRQLFFVNEKHVLNNLDKKIANGEIALVDGVPMYVTEVIYIGVDFFRINNIDITRQNFDVEFFLWFRWSGDKFNTDNIGFINGVFKEENKRDVIRNDFSGEVKYIAYKIKGTFLNPFNLRNFPYDTQKLPIKLSSSNKDVNQLMIVVDKHNLSHAKLNVIYPEEWINLGREDYSSYHEEHSTFGDPNYTSVTQTVAFSVYESNIILKRILLPYMFTLFMPLFMMLLIGFLILWIPEDQFEARLSLIMTLLLSIIVFHMTKSDQLPSVGYVIAADLYFIVAYIVMSILIAKVVFVNVFLKQGNRNIVKKIRTGFRYTCIPLVIIIYFYITVTSL